MKRHFGFTLAEVLITLGIIGVVAAMTIPTLIQKHQKQTILTQLKKAYSELGQAIQLAEVENESREYWDFSLSGEQFFKTYLSHYIKINETTSNKLRQNTKYYNMSGQEYNGGYIWNNNYIVTTNSGYTLFFETWNDTRNQYIFIDVNSPSKGPNTFGKDLHSFLLWKDKGLQPLNVLSDYSNPTADRQALLQKCKIHGDCCTAVIMMDNWQFSSDYPW